MTHQAAPRAVEAALVSQSLGANISVPKDAASWKIVIEAS